MIAFPLLLAAVSVFSLFDAGTMGHSFGRFFWIRDPASGFKFPQKAFSVDSGPRVLITTYGRNLGRNGLQFSKTLIDFSTDPPVTAVLLYKTRACYLIETDLALTYEDVVDEFRNRTRTTVTEEPSDLFVSAIDQKLDSAARTQLFTTNPALRKICKSTVFTTTVTAETSAGNCQTLLSTVTFNDTLSILTPIKCRSRQGPRHVHYG